MSHSPVSLASLPLHSPWKTILLEDAGILAHPQDLTPLARGHGQAFLDQHPELFEPLADNQVFALNHWYSSAEGQQTLAAVTRKLWRQMSEHAEYAMPAHDARHAMYKVPAAAVQHAQAEGVQGWERVGFLGALLHDHGRWAEERVLGGPGESVLHARLSFLLGAEALREFEMPELIRHHILLSALRHTSGADENDPMPLKLTVAADRDHLYGPEIVLRLTHHAPMPNGGMRNYYPDPAAPADKVVIDDLARFLGSRLPGPLFARQGDMRQLWAVLCNFLLMAEEQDVSRARFEQLRLRDKKNSMPADFNWDAQWPLAQSAALKFHEASPDEPTESALLALITAPNCAPSAQYLDMAVAKFHRMLPEQQVRVARGLRYVDGMRKKFDAEQSQSLREIALTADLFTKTVVGLVLPGLRDTLRLKGATLPSAGRP